MTISDLTVTDLNGDLKKINKSDRSLIRATRAIWTFENASREFSAGSDQLFVAVISPSLQEMVVFCKGFRDYKPPCNVIVLNGDGSVRLKLCPPKLVSDAFLAYEKKVGPVKAVEDIRFIQPEIIHDGNKEEFFLWIGFAYDWYEVRQLNLKTGEFGKCLRSARM
jgi:hypothetical protein